MKMLFRWTVPGGIILAGALAMALGAGPGGLVSRMVSGYPWAVYGVAVLLAGFFHRSRVVAGVLAVGAVTWVSASGAGGFTALYFAGGILALTLAGLSLSRDRGVLSLPGVLQLGGITALGISGALFVVGTPGDVATLLAAEPLPTSLTYWSGLPQPVFLAFAVGLSISLGAALVRRGAVERGVFWSLAMVALALYFGAEAEATQLFLMGAGLTLGLSVLQTSYAMAYRDDLTGLPARRALMRDLEGLGGIYSAAMVDVDRFKRFNDRYGHDVGDQVLRMVASRLARTPGGGRPYRYGGEEFTLLFPGKSKEEALEHLERVRERVEGSAFTLRHWRRPRKRPSSSGGPRRRGRGEPRRLRVTVSIGVADSAGGDADPEGVLKRADRALYRAKKGGRNRVAR